MIKSTYKPGKDIFSWDKDKNNYYQYYCGDELYCKGYIKNYNHIGYKESYRAQIRLNKAIKGIKYRI
jgi:hypothetical protein